MSREYLSDKDTLIVSKPLARALGVGSSIVLRRVQNWLEFNESHKSEKHFHDGKWWMFNGYGGWAEDIEIYSISTIRRLLSNLVSLGLLLVADKYNKRKSDQTKWYTIDYEAYDKFIALWQQHDCPLFRDGKPSKEYQKFLNTWQPKATPVHSEPLSTVNITPVHSEQGGVSIVNREPLSTVSIALPDRNTDRKTDRTKNKSGGKRQPISKPIFDAVAKFVFEIVEPEKIKGSAGSIGAIAAAVKRQYEAQFGEPNEEIAALTVERYIASVKPDELKYIQNAVSFEPKYIKFIQAKDTAIRGYAGLPAPSSATPPPNGAGAQHVPAGWTAEQAAAARAQATFDLPISRKKTGTGSTENAS